MQKTGYNFEAMLSYGGGRRLTDLPDVILLLGVVLHRAEDQEKRDLERRNAEADEVGVLDKSVVDEDAKEPPLRRHHGPEERSCEIPYGSRLTIILKTKSITVT
jgi:hypothetical protein